MTEMKNENDLLTVDDRLDLGHAHDSFDVLRSVVGETKGCAFQRSIINQTLEDGPELGNFALLWDARVVDENQVGDEAKLVERFLDVGSDGFWGRLEV